VRFENADAQTHSFAPQSFDLLFSRFGVMFFVDPGAAFANLARALRPGGRLGFVCWQSFMENAWMREPMMALAQHVTLQPPPPPDAPGPFAFSDAKRVTRILEGAGFKGVAFAPHTGQLSLGSSVESAARFSLEMGPLGAALRDAPESTKTVALDALRETFAKIATPNGVSLPFAAWIATGTR
jgi:SAM-dependent methyltransferase